MKDEKNEFWTTISSFLLLSWRRRSHYLIEKQSLLCSLLWQSFWFISRLRIIFYLSRRRVAWFFDNYLFYLFLLFCLFYRRHANTLFNCISSSFWCIFDVYFSFFELFVYILLIKIFLIYRMFLLMMWSSSLFSRFLSIMTRYIRLYVIARFLLLTMISINASRNIS